MTTNKKVEKSKVETKNLLPMVNPRENRNCFSLERRAERVE